MGCLSAHSVAHKLEHGLGSLQDFLKPGPVIAWDQPRLQRTVTAGIAITAITTVIITTATKAVVTVTAIATAGRYWSRFVKKVGQRCL